MTSKSTKRALITSVLSILMCVAMLIGATFAWFTDTASTGVNKIQAGTLDVALEMATEWNDDGTVKTWVNAEGRTLTWKKAAGAPADEQVLWEPGCTYELPELRIVNKGSLALKYKIQITGIQGNAKLNEAIEWTITNTSATTTALDEDHRLAAGASDTLTISGQMKDSAGNEYQGLSIDNIAITVVATQDTVENDSFDNQYDVNAVYPVAPTLSNTTVAGTIKSDENTTLGNMSDTESPTFAEITIPSGAVDTDTNAVFNMNLTDLRPDSVTYEISLNGATGTPVTLAQPAKVTTNIGANLTNVVVKHSDTPMRNVRLENGLTDGTYYYNKSTGKLIICTRSFSPFEISYDFNPVASVNGVGYTTLSSAIATAQNGDTVVMLKDASTSGLAMDKDITLDLNGYILKKGLTGNYIVNLKKDSTVTIKNGTISNNSNVGAGVYLGQGNNHLTLQNVTISSKYIGVWSNSGKNTATIENSNISSKFIGVYQNGNYGGNTFNICKTKITDTRGVGVYISNSVNNEKQTLNIDDCTISGPSGVEIKHTNATITHSTLIGTSTPTGSGVNGNGTCTDGYAFAVSTNGENDEVTGTVSVSDCKFYNGTATEGDPNGYVFVYQVAEGSSVTINGTPVTDYNTYGGEVSEGGSKE